MFFCISEQLKILHACAIYSLRELLIFHTYLLNSVIMFHLGRKRSTDGKEQNETVTLTLNLVGIFYSLKICKCNAQSSQENGIERKCEFHKPLKIPRLFPLHHAS